MKARFPFHPRFRNLPSDLPFIWNTATLRNGTIVTLDTDLGAIDLLAEVKGRGAFDDVRAQSVVVNAVGHKVRTLDLKSLIESKRAARRETDLLVLPELESLLESQASDQD